MLKMHYQGRLKAHSKVIMESMISLVHGYPCLQGAHVTPTSKKIAGAGKPFSYVLKAQSRIAGPWSDQDEAKPELPGAGKIDKLQSDIQKAEDEETEEALGAIVPRLWQQQIITKIQGRPPDSNRTVNILIDPIGSSGMFHTFLNTCLPLANTVLTCLL